MMTPPLLPRHPAFRSITRTRTGGIAARTLAVLAGFGLAAIQGPAAHAQAFPSQPLRVVVPYAAGGSGDMLVRTLGERVSRQLGQPVTVDNRPGGGTVIGAQAVASAPANGHTLLLIAGSFVINPHLMAKLPYDTWKDFAPVSLLASNPHVLVVHPSVPANDLAAFLGWARSRNGAATFASFGSGSSGHLGFELLKKAAGIAMVHVPYKGVAPATTDLLGGQVDAMLSDLPQVVGHVKAGKLRALGIASEARVPSLPGVPTLAEAGLPGFASKSWYGLLVRSGAPADAVTRLNAAFVGALRDPAVLEKMEPLGMDVIASTPAQFGTYMREESERYAEAVRISGAKAE